MGHPQIDEQHRRLFLLAESVVDPLMHSAEHNSGLMQLEALIDFTQEHFAFEEDLMRSAGYPEGDKYAKYHASLLTEIRTYCSKVRQGRNTNPVALISFLWDWLLVHIDSTDRELVAWLNSRDPDGRPPVINAPTVG